MRFLARLYESTGKAIVVTTASASVSAVEMQNVQVLKTCITWTSEWI